MFIKLSVKDADKVLSYLRKELKTNKDAFEDFLSRADMIAQVEIDKAKEQGIDPDGKFGNLAKELAKRMMTERHNREIALLEELIEILTCGSREE